MEADVEEAPTKARPDAASEPPHHQHAQAQKMQLGKDSEQTSGEIVAKPKLCFSLARGLSALKMHSHRSRAAKPKNHHEPKTS